MQRGDGVNPDAALRARLHALVEQPVAGARAPDGVRPAAPVDRIVVSVDHDGQAILPDAEAAVRRAADASTTNELRFTFDSPDQPWTDAELRSLRRRAKPPGIRPVMLRNLGGGQFMARVATRHWLTAAAAGPTQVMLNVGGQCFTHAVTLVVP